MKKLLLLFTLIVFLLTGCKSTPEDIHGLATVDDILILFEQYWNLGEDIETGNEIMQLFRKEPALLLEALSLSGASFREQILILIGSVIAAARRNDPAAYAEYNEALNLAAGLDLNEDSARMLRFVNANIEYWYRH